MKFKVCDVVIATKACQVHNILILKNAKFSISAINNDEEATIIDIYNAKNIIPISIDMLENNFVLDDTSIIKSDKVNHPYHYQWLREKCNIEPIDICRHLNFNLGNAIKYILRAGYKSEKGYTTLDKEIEDIKKALWYLQDHLNVLINRKNEEN